MGGAKIPSSPNTKRAVRTRLASELNSLARFPTPSNRWASSGSLLLYLPLMLLMYLPLLLLLYLPLLLLLLLYLPLLLRHNLTIT